MPKRDTEGLTSAPCPDLPLAPASGLVLIAAVLVAGYFYFVQTRSGQAFDNVAYFGHSSVDREGLKYDADLLSQVQVRTLAVAAVALLILAAIRRRFLCGPVIVGALAFAVIGAEWLKHHLPREELSPPGGAVPAYFAHDTYPSGHTTVGTSVALALLLLLPARWRPWLAPVAGFVSASYATAVLFAGWHRPSDAVGGILWSGLCLGLAGLVLVMFRRSSPRVPVLAKVPLGLSIVAGVVTYVLAWACTGWAGVGYPNADLPFLVMTGAMVLAAYAVTAWLGWLYSDSL